MENNSKDIDEFIEEIVQMEKTEQFHNSPSDRKRKINDALKKILSQNNDH